MSSDSKRHSRLFAPLLPLWSGALLRNSKVALRTRKGLENHVVVQCLRDHRYRERFLLDPRSVLEMELENRLPDEVQVEVLEDTEHLAHVVFPSNPVPWIAAAELKESLGMSLDDLAAWALEHQRNGLLEGPLGTALLARVWTDETFGERLIRNTRTELECALGIQIDDDLNVEVKLERPNQLYFVLPFLADERIDYEAELAALQTELSVIAVGACSGAHDVTNADTLLCPATDPHLPGCP